MLTPVDPSNDFQVISQRQTILPRISVIIPCYNQAEFLSEAVDSVLSQSLESLECIIVNDGSPDNTREVALALCAKDHRVRYIEQANQGLSGARNAGLKEATGELIQFLDADDKLEFNKIKSQSDYLIAHPDVDIVFGDARYFTTEDPALRDCGPYADKEGEPWIRANWEKPGDVCEKILARNPFPVNCPLIRRTVFEKVGNWSLQLKALEDWEFWIRCAAANLNFDFNDSPNSYSLIRMHAASMTRDTPRMNQAIIDMRILVGPLIASRKLRLLNYTIGIKKLNFLNPPNVTRRAIALAKANYTFHVFILAGHYVILRYSGFHWIARMYKKHTPWPIQTFLSGINPNPDRKYPKQ